MTGPLLVSRLDQVQLQADTQSRQLNLVRVELTRLRGWILGLSCACLVLLALVVITLAK